MGRGMLHEIFETRKNGVKWVIRIRNITKTFLSKIKSKPIWVVAIISVLSLIIIGWNLFTIVWIDQKMKGIISYGEELAEMEETQALLLRQEAAEQEYLLGGDTQYLIQHKQFETLTDFHLKQAEDFQTDQEELTLIREVGANRDAYEALFVKLTEQYQSGDVDRAIQISLEESDPTIQRVHSQVEDFATTVEDQLDAATVSADNLIRLSLWGSTALLVAFALISYIALSIDNRIMKPVVILAVLISVIVIGWDTYNIWRLKEDIHSVVFRLEETDQIQQTEVFLIEQEIAELEYLLTGDAVHLERHREIETITDEHWTQALAKQTEPDELELLDAIKKDHDAYEKAFKQIVVLYKNGNKEEAVRLSGEENSAAIDAIQERVDEYVGVIESKMEAELSRVDQITAIALTIGIFTFIILAVESVIAVSVTAQVLTPVVLLIEATRAIENETYDVKMLDEAASRQDEIGGLARMFQNMAKTVYKRTAELKEQVQQLRIEIDQTKRQKQVSEIVDSDFFKDLQGKASSMRKRSSTPDSNKDKDQPA